jgi:hypothetical protein
LAARACELGRIQCGEIVLKGERCYIPALSEGGTSVPFEASPVIPPPGRNQPIRSPTRWLRRVAFFRFWGLFLSNPTQAGARWASQIDILNYINDFI